MTLLSAELSVFHESECLVEHIAIKIGRGQAVTLIGETGSGKSLFAQAILGTLPEELHAKGELQLESATIDLRHPSDIEPLWGRKISVLPQEPWRALDPLMPSKQQVAEVHQLVANKADAPRLAEEALAAMGLSEAKHRFPFELSGGMAQRLAVAAARAGGAKIVVADEPTKGLDISRRDDVAAQLRSVPESGGALLTITHDLQLAEALGGEIIVMREGRVVEKGPATSVLSSPKEQYTAELIAAEPRHWQEKEPATLGSVVLQGNQLTIVRGKRHLFNDMSITLRAGEVVGLCGPSGVGKSSLGDVLLGLLEPQEGSVVRSSTASQIKFQKLWQDPPAAFSPHQTIGRGLKDLMLLHGISRDRLEPLLSQLRIDPELLNRTPDAVSGGELQRLAIARALLLEPVFLFADEPTSRLDPLTQRDVMEMLTSLAKERGIAMLLVSHDPSLIDKSTDRQITLGW
ncbi:ATP-binding cassette domain-containing protein [Enterovibrio sp. ZSDZ35]|uniref:ATP-binding cassette domain-containing protein n=1 Tax=Enterovibrio qingdaonensis TaxID=2899818 RepID=A0ABT5QJK9_9GAMM|nr:ATP-binding cassette domain-containing protein [Enterovibrio sp. ZSDZ35]MDD1781168.1 ATP-binding cassette domain-containing protein [Enterovibrio sp. ZSDZ35]